MSDLWNRWPGAMIPADMEELGQRVSARIPLWLGATIALASLWISGVIAGWEATFGILAAFAGSAAVPLGPE